MSILTLHATLNKHIHVIGLGTRLEGSFEICIIPSHFHNIANSSQFASMDESKVRVDEVFMHRYEPVL